MGLIKTPYWAVVQLEQQDDPTSSSFRFLHSPHPTSSRVHGVHHGRFSQMRPGDPESIGGVRARDDAGGVADLPQRHHQHRRRGRLRALLLCSVPGLLLIKLKTAERRTLWIVKWLVTMTLREHPERVILEFCYLI